MEAAIQVAFFVEQTDDVAGECDLSRSLTPSAAATAAGDGKTERHGST